MLLMIFRQWPNQTPFDATCLINQPWLPPCQSFTNSTHSLHLSHAHRQVSNLWFPPSSDPSRTDSANRLALGGHRDQNSLVSTAAGGLGQVQHAAAVMQGIGVPQSNQRRMPVRPTEVDDEEDFLAKSKRLCIAGKIKANRGLRTVVNYRCDDS